MNLEGFAGAARALAERAESDLAATAARAGAKELLAAMFVVTPVRSGALRGSETVQSVTGGGAVAVAKVGPDIIYDKFRNDGGTITRKTPGSLGTPAAGFFGHSVTQRGAHYMEAAEAEGGPMVDGAIRVVVADFLKL